MTGNEAVTKHRQERARKLMEAVRDFVDTGQLCRFDKNLSDFKVLEDARQHLQSRSAAGVNNS